MYNVLMKRTLCISVDEANSLKKNGLDTLFVESKRVINLFIEELWKQKDFSSKYIGFKVQIYLSARMQQSLGKQALQVEVII